MLETDQGTFDLGMQSILGIGTDLVYIPQLAVLLETPGSVFGEPGVVFTSRELRRAKERAGAKGDSPAHHLAAVWAIKEAALKAWVGALEREGLPLPLREDQVVWAEITVTHSSAGAPQVRLIGEMARVFGEGLPLSPAGANRSGSPSDASAPPANTTPEVTSNAGSTSTKPAVTWHASASHDEDYALGFVVLSRDT